MGSGGFEGGGAGDGRGAWVSIGASAWGKKPQRQGKELGHAGDDAVDGFETARMAKQLSLHRQSYTT